MSYVFGAMITISFIYAVFSGNMEQMSSGIPEAAGSAIELLISISGMLIMWSGFMRIAKDCGLIEKLSGLFAPLLRRLYPDVAVDSDGIKAMGELKKHSVNATATDSMVTFVLMNTASMQLIPTTVAALRKSYGSAQPFDVLLCVWITSTTALTAALVSSDLIRRLRWKRSSPSSLPRCASTDYSSA